MQSATNHADQTSMTRLGSSSIRGVASPAMSRDRSSSVQRSINDNQPVASSSALDSGWMPQRTLEPKRILAESQSHFVSPTGAPRQASDNVRFNNEAVTCTSSVASCSNSAPSRRNSNAVPLHRPQAQSGLALPQLRAEHTEV